MRVNIWGVLDIGEGPPEMRSIFSPFAAAEFRGEWHNSIQGEDGERHPTLLRGNTSDSDDGLRLCRYWCGPPDPLRDAYASWHKCSA